MGEALNFDTIDAEYEKPGEVVTVGTVLDLDVIRPKIEDFKREAVRIAADAKALTVTDQESLNIAVMLGGSAKKISKAIDAQRKKVILEPAEFVKGVNAICKMVTDQLDEAERVTKQKIGTHQARVEMERLERERKAREEAAALQRKLDAEVAEANRKAREEAEKRAEAEARARKASEAEVEAEKLKAAAMAKANEVIAPTVVTPVVQSAPKVTRTEAGSASQRKVWEFMVIDPLLVPREFLLVSDNLVRDAVKMGTRSIPGIEIFENTKTVFRS